MYENNNIWKRLQEHLPENCKIDEDIFPEEKYLYYDKSRIHLDIYKPNEINKIVVILFHGVGGNGRLLSFLAVPLVKYGFNVICPDLPGYGFTEYNGKTSYQSWIDIGDYIVKNEITKGNTVFLMGLSAGGMLAYNIACKNKNVSGLIVTNILDNREKDVIKYSAKNEFIGHYGMKLMKKIPLFLRKIKLPIKMVTNMNGIVNNKNVLKLLLKDKRGSGSKVSIHFLLTMMEYKPLLEAFNFNNIPVLLAHPGDDKWTPLHISELFFNKLSTMKEKILLDNAGHFPIEEPGINQLIKGIIDFINKYEKGNNVA
jgi:alpha-beta hydrolase superfamily lysophospholipase